MIGLRVEAVLVGGGNPLDDGFRPFGQDAVLGPTRGVALLGVIFGDRRGVDLFLAAVVTLGGRVFLNLSLIRRYWLTQVALSRNKEG